MGKIIKGFCVFLIISLFILDSVKAADNSRICKLWNSFAEAGASLVREYKTEHDDRTISQKGIGLFYGSKSWYSRGINEYKLEPHEAIEYVRLLIEQGYFENRLTKEEAIVKQAKEKAKNILPISPPIKTDCLEWCIFNISRAFGQAGMEKDWIMIKTAALEKSLKNPTQVNYGVKGIIGTELAKVLIVKEGWIGLYYNPDTLLPGDKPAFIPSMPKKNSVYFEDWKSKYYMWTEHSVSYVTAKKQKVYKGIPVSDFIIDYRPTSKLWDLDNRDDDGNYKDIPVVSPTISKTDKVNRLKKVPFGFLLARGGRHAALISYGKVYEVHYTAEPWSEKLIEVKDFETEWGWFSGIIIVPPKSW